MYTESNSGLFYNSLFANIYELNILSFSKQLPPPLIPVFMCMYVSEGSEINMRHVGKGAHVFPFIDNLEDKYLVPSEDSSCQSINHKG